MVPKTGGGNRLPLLTSVAEPAPLHSPLSDSAVQEWRAISREQDPQMLPEDLLGFGMRREQSGELEAAAEVYARITATVGEGALRQRAQQRLDAMLGRGSTGPRAEFLLRRLTQEATEPGALFAMTLAGSVFRVTRLCALSQLAGTSEIGFWTRGWGARALAGLVAFSVEAPTFTLGERLAGEALGRPQDWSHTSLLRSFASGYLFLGGMRLTGWAGQSLHQSLGFGTSTTRELLFTQGSALGGLLLAHRLEQWAHLRPSQDGATTLVDSLASLLQFHVAGNLSRGLSGPHWANWEASLNARSERIFSMRPLATQALAMEGLEEIQNPNLLMMNGEGPKGPRNGASRFPPGSAPRLDPIRVTNLYMILVNLRSALRQTQPALTYEGRSWEENRDASAIAGRLREATPLPRGKTLELLLPQQEQKVTFFWEGDEIQYRVISLRGEAPGSETDPSEDPIWTSITVPKMPALRPTVKSLAIRQPASDGTSDPSSESPPTLPNLWKSYESGLDREIEEFYRSVIAKPPSAPLLDREEACALRGWRLARIANFALRGKDSAEDTQPSLQPLTVAVKIHQFLERAYRHFDFGTIQSFQDRLSLRASRNFTAALELQNQRRSVAGLPELPSLAVLPTQAPGYPLVPRTEKLRNAFLTEFWASTPESETTQRISVLLSDPQATGKLLAAALYAPIQQFVADNFLLQGMFPEGTPAELLQLNQSFRSAEARELRFRIHGLLNEVPELSRILVDGRGKFHRDFVRTLFFETSTPLRDVYPQFYFILDKLPEELHGLSQGRLFLPTLGQVRTFTKYHSQPPRR